MEEKQGKSCGKDSTSSEDDSSTQRRAVEEEHEQNHSGSYYSAHIASVCEALNAQAEKSTSRFEELMLKKRRATNRLGAQNRRKRRGDEIKHLLEQQRCLVLESQELVAEKASLQAELHHEVSMTSLASNNATPLQLPTQQIRPAQLLQNILPQHQRLQSVLIPNINPAATPSTALFDRLMTTSSRFDTTLLEAQIRNNNAQGGEPFSTTQRSPSVMSLGMLELLSLLQASQGSVASAPPIHPPWIVTQPLTATASAPIGSLSARAQAHASSENRRESLTFYSKELDKNASFHPRSRKNPRARDNFAKYPNL